MNVMTVTDTATDVQMQVKNDPQPDAQDFASKLDQANTQQTEEGKSMPEARKAEKAETNEDNPESGKTDKNKNKDQENTTNLFQGPIPLVVLAKATEAERLAGDGNETAGQSTQAADGAAQQINPEVIAQAVATEVIQAQTLKTTEDGQSLAPIQSMQPAEEGKEPAAPVQNAQVENKAAALCRAGALRDGHIAESSGAGKEPTQPVMQETMPAMQDNTRVQPVCTGKP